MPLAKTAEDAPQQYALLANPSLWRRAGAVPLIAAQYQEQKDRDEASKPKKGMEEDDADK